MSDTPLVTVAILTYNGEIYLRRILGMLRAQVLEGDFEVLVIDSGSSDETLSILSDFPEVRLHQIPNSEFGHGKTRNLAAQLSRGEYIAFLTHDAVPLSPSWLRELLAPFSVDSRVVGVMGKQVPRPGCFPLMKYEIRGVFAGFGPDFGTTVFYRDEFVRDSGTLAAVTFYSDVNSAARRSVLTDEIPYQDVRYAEDQLFGKDLIEAGYHKAYAARGAVEHSNDLTWREFGYRIFDETVGLRQIGVEVAPMSRLSAYARSVRGALRDTPAIARDREYSGKRRLYWLVVNPFYHLRKWTSYRKATLAILSDEAGIQAGSLEHRRRIGG
jgi:rhamnosyltransferase